MHRRQHVMGVRIPQIIFRQVVALYRIVRPQEEMRFWLVGKEGVTVRPQVPKVMVRLYKRVRSRRFTPLATDRPHLRSPSRRSIASGQGRLYDLEASFMAQ